jgi:hypothetical protein
MAVTKAATKEQPQEKLKITTGLGEAMGGLMILFLLLPFSALCLRATVEIVRPQCPAPEVNNGR